MHFKRRINVFIFLLFPGTPLGKVLYNFESRSSSELQVNAGDLVKIINKKGCHIFNIKNLINLFKLESCLLSIIINYQHKGYKLKNF